jgi:type I restriction enzyme, S subunit
MHTQSPSLRFSSFKEGWKEQRLSKFFTSSRAKGKDGMPTLSVTLNRGLINRDEIDRKTETNLEADEHLLVRPDDIAYNMMRMWQGAFGRSDREGIVSPAYVVLRPLAAADSGYFEYAFRRPRSIYLFWAYSYGLTNDRLRLYANDFLRIPFSAPALPEQRKIADFLTAVDGRLAQLSQKKALLEAYKKGVMQQLLTQALRFKDDHGNDFPDWEEKTLGDITRNVMYGMNAAAKEFDGETKYIRITDIDENSNRFRPDPVTSPDQLAEDRYKLRLGDIVFARTGASVGKSYLYDEADGNLAFAGFLIRFSISQKEANPYFVFLQTQTGEYWKWVKVNSMRSGQPGINAEEYKTLPILLPSLPEQTKIANFLTALDRKIEAVAAQTAHTQTWKKGLLQQMFV